MNVAPTVCPDDIVTLHVPPEHAPVHPPNVAIDESVTDADKFTIVPELYDAEHVLPQFIPPGLEVTVP